MINAELYQRYSSDPLEFISSLQIDVSGTIRRFAAVMDDFQRDDFAKLAPGMLKCAGRCDDDPDAKLRALAERPRGASKTCDLSAVAAYLLAFATRPLRGYAYAADKDQARLLRDAMQTLIRLNPWLSTILEVQAHSVVNIASGHPAEGGSLTIEASDIGSSFGILPDFIIVDELTHWEENASGLWESLISSAAKRTNCLMLIIQNAGYVDSWQWSVREAIRQDDGWIFSRLEGQASWMSEAHLAEQRRLLPPIAYARLWENQWSSGGGDALTPEDISAAFPENLTPMTGREPNWQFVGGVDLGLTRDCSAVIVLGVPSGGTGGRIRLAHHRLWRPTLGKKIDLLEVEKHLLECEQRYKLEFCAFDPWQAELLGQRIEIDAGRRRRNSKRRFANLPFMREIAPTAANLREQATLTIECFQDRRMQLFECEPLRYDLQHLRVEERPSGGFRLTSPKDAQGHGDTASAFLLALLMAHEVSGKRKQGPLGAWNFDGSVGNRGGWQSQLAAIATAQEYEEVVAAGNDGRNSGLKQMFRSFGR